MDSAELYHRIAQDGVSISTDTRTIRKGAVYLALKGESFDGNKFAHDALVKGARFSIVDDPSQATDARCILVKDTKKTLEELAHIHRTQYSIPVITIGGSNGKTTTKELVAAVLEKKYRIHTTKGNLNNDIGVPLTILEMPLDTEIAIIEIGANHHGEHTALLTIVSPTHVLVTNNGADHLEGFGSIEGARKANKEIYDWAFTHDAKAFVNKTILDLVNDSEKIKNRILYPTDQWEPKEQTTAALKYKNVEITSQLFGSYNIPNLLAAITIGNYFDVPLESIQEAITSYTPSLKRSQIIPGEDYTLILDCYNANPSSMELALGDFHATTPAGKRIFLVGDMLEMGTEEKAVHKKILDFLATLVEPNDICLIVGPRFGIYKEHYPFTFFDSATSAREVFDNLDLKGKHIFVKASRGIKLEEVIKEKAPL